MRPFSSSSIHRSIQSLNDTRAAAAPRFSAISTFFRISAFFTAVYWRP